MSDVVRAKLVEIVGRFGPVIADDSKRCEAVLRDLCGEHRREIFVLVSAVREGVTKELRSSSGTPRSAVLARMTKRLYEELGVEEKLARWAVETWDLALRGRVPFQCANPECRAVGTMPRSLIGRRVLCSTCKTPFTVGHGAKHGAKVVDEGTTRLSAQADTETVPAPSAPASRAQSPATGPTTSQNAGTIGAQTRGTIKDPFTDGMAEETSLQFYCPQGHLLTAPRSQMGQQSQCPMCGMVFLVPVMLAQSPAGPSACTRACGPPGAARPQVAAAPSDRRERKHAETAAIKQRVIDIVAEQLGVSREQITSEVRFVADLGADSLDTVELVMEFEEEFDINIPDDVAEKAETVGQAIEYIERVCAGTDPPRVTSAHDPISEAPQLRWHVMIPPGNDQYGPETGDTLRTWLNEQRVTADALVWREDWADWRRAGSVFPYPETPQPPDQAAPITGQAGAPAKPAAPAVKPATPPDRQQANAAASKSLAQAPHAVRKALATMLSHEQTREKGFVAGIQARPEAAEKLHAYMAQVYRDPRKSDGFGHVVDMGHGNGELAYASPAGVLMVKPPAAEGQPWTVAYSSRDYSKHQEIVARSARSPPKSAPATTTQTPEAGGQDSPRKTPAATSAPDTGLAGPHEFVEQIAEPGLSMADAGRATFKPAPPTASQSSVQAAKPSGPSVPAHVDLRTQRLGDMVGQRGVIAGLEIALGAARKRGESLGHILFVGPSGLGKATFATAIARELGVSLQIASGNTLRVPQDVIPYLTNAEEHSVFFINEIHRLPKAVQEFLYPAMGDFRIDIALGDGVNARTINMNLRSFTLIGATTRPALLPARLRDHFRLREHFDFYTADELAEIIRRNAAKLGSQIADAAAREIATRSRGTPRLANNRLRWVRDYATSKADGRITLDLTQAALDMQGIDARGLDSQDRKYLETIVGAFGGGPVGIEAVAHSINAVPETLEYEVEPYLLRTGLIVRTTRGRKATPAAYAHLGVVANQTGR